MPELPLPPTPREILGIQTLKGDVEVGDYIIFRAITRWGADKVKRKVTHIEEIRDTPYRVGVTYGGWRPFWVRIDEIIEVIKE